jgi:hypothetical protein
VPLNADVFISVTNEVKVDFSQSKQSIEIEKNMNNLFGKYLKNIEIINEKCKNRTKYDEEFYRDFYHIDSEKQETLNYPVFNELNSSQCDTIKHKLQRPQAFKVYRANQLKKEYETINNFEYDIVIRLRLDIYVTEQVYEELNYIIQNFDKDLLYIGAIEKYNCYRIWDGFFFASSKIMNKICSLYTNYVPLNFYIDYRFFKNENKHEMLWKVCSARWCAAYEISLLYKILNENIKIYKLSNNFNKRCGYDNNIINYTFKNII